MNEEKVREAIKTLKDAVHPFMIDKALLLLKEAIAPEIPEGCPVLCKKVHGDGFTETSETHYYETMEQHWDDVEIDYQRKGAVIPWHGGECPVDGDTLVSCFFGSSGVQRRLQAQYFRWGWEDSGKQDDIIAYVIWPEWVKGE